MGAYVVTYFLCYKKLKKKQKKKKHRKKNPKIYEDAHKESLSRFWAE
jgi:hypothetical protein